MITPQAALADRRLWQSVVIQAITDATGMTPDLRAQREQHEAREWLTSGSEDFAEVCAAAGLDPIRVRREAVELIAKADAGEAKPIRRQSAQRKAQDCAESRRRPGNGRKPSIFIEHDGLQLTLGEWSKRIGVPKGTLDARRRAGLPVESILAPSGPRFGNGPKKKSRGYQATSSDRIGTGGGSSAHDNG